MQQLMTNANIKSNPFVQFILEQTNYFANESIRLRDKSILVAHKELTDTFFSIVQKLGTVEHEEALAKLSNQYGKAGSDVAEAWCKIWRTFNQKRREASALEHKFKSYDAKAKSKIRAFEDTLTTQTFQDDEITQLLREALVAMKRATLSGKRLSKKWWKGPWLFLWFDLYIYTVYVRYLIVRFTFLALHHSFDFVVFFLITSFAYSKATSALKDAISEIVTPLPWIAGAIIFGSYKLKKLYIDKKVKRLLVRLEEKWLSKVAIHLYMVRTFALRSRTQARKTPDEA
jgi:hypothetical protein